MSFSDEAQGAEKQNQEKHEITSDTQMKTTPKTLITFGFSNTYYNF